jgi:hypothetical protein
VNDIQAAPELAREAAGCAVMADRGYDSEEFRKLLKGNNNEPVIPGRKNRKEPWSMIRNCIRNADISSGYSERSKRTGGLRYGMKNRI